MTYYGYNMLFRFTCECDWTRTVGPIFQKYAYQYAGLATKQVCKEHRAREVGRTATIPVGPHGRWISVGGTG